MYELRIKKEGSTTTLAVLLALLLSKMRKNEKKSVRERENLRNRIFGGRVYYPFLGLWRRFS